MKKKILATALVLSLMLSTLPTYASKSGTLGGATAYGSVSISSNSASASVSVSTGGSTSLTLNYSYNKLNSIGSIIDSINESVTVSSGSTSSASKSTPGGGSGISYRSVSASAMYSAYYNTASWSDMETVYN